MAEMSDQELLESLGVETKSEKKSARSPREERIIAGFEEIQRFVDQHGRSPEHGEHNDIFERLYATRLDQIRASDECRSTVHDLDHQGLLTDAPGISEPSSEYESDEELLAQLGVEPPKESDVTFLKHVKTRAEIRAAEEIATRTPCEDFEKFRPLFETVQNEMKTGAREARLLTKNAQINQGDFFILNGQKVYVAEISDQRTYGFDNNDYRLRVIYDNGTESDLLLRSLQRALDKDDAGRRIIEATAGPLFSDIHEEDDLASGTIYVLRSNSEHPFIANNRDIIHKIGVTGGKVEKRIVNARLDPTYLMADVEIVATYELYNISRSKLENLLHRFFDPAKLDIKIEDRFGNPIVPREWFLVPLFVIDEVIEKVKSGTIVNFTYDVSEQKIRKSNK
jgi:hypothetical protein